MVGDASEKPEGLYDWHSADETSGSLRHRSLAPERMNNALAEGLVLSCSCTRHWLSVGWASQTAWASACDTCPVHTAVHGKSGEGGSEGGGGPARAGASSKARRSHQHIRRRHFGGAEASTMSALAAAAAAAALPVSEVKSSLTSSVLGAETGRPLRSASASRSVSGVPNASTACRAPQGGCACAREGTRTSSRRDATQRACITQRLRACLPRPGGGVAPLARLLGASFLLPTRVSHWFDACRPRLKGVAASRKILRGKEIECA